MANNKLLVLKLEGVLQAWGEGFQWDYRDTALFPSKSAIIGLLGCALGIPRNSERLVTLNQAISIGVRADRPGQKIRDYQSVTGNPLMTADGGRRNPSNIITPKNYLSDACFTVFIEGSAALLEELEDALKAAPPAVRFSWSVLKLMRIFWMRSSIMHLPEGRIKSCPMSVRSHFRVDPILPLFARTTS